MAINGNNILILMDGQAKAGTRSNEIQCDCKIIEISSSTDKDWEAVIAGLILIYRHGAAHVNPRQHNDRIVYGYTLDNRI